MPCPDCGHILVYENEKEILYCPDCLNVPVADQDQIKQRATQIREQYLNNSELIGLLNQFGSLRVIAEFLHNLNGGAYGLKDENRMDFQKFFTTVPIVKSVYENWDQFDHHYDPENTEQQEQLKEDVEDIIRAGSLLIPVLEQIEEDFVCVQELSPIAGDWTDFYANHRFPHTEFWWCTERCMKANVGAREEVREAYLEQQRIFRTFSKPDREGIETVRDFGEFWYGLIAELGFAATLEETLQTAFTTYLPDSVTIFDIQALIGNVNEVVDEDRSARGPDNYDSIAMEEEEFDECGEDVFGEDWDEVKDHILVKPGNTDAHPMFFQISGTRELKLPNWRRSRSIPFDRILYPDYFTYLLQMQIFPLLENGELRSSRDVLMELTAERGLEFERNVYEYLDDQGFEAYHSCKTAKQDGNEIDVMFVMDEALYFVEVKFVLPTLNMQTQTGIESVDESFDVKVFRDGPAFDEKVEAWTQLDAGDEFTHQEGPDAGDRVSARVDPEWDELDVEMFVVSNFVPSYLQKRGVQFLTDLELHQWVEYGEDVFVEVLH